MSSRERQQNDPPIDAACHRRNEQARQNREYAGDRDGLARRAFGDLEVRGDRRQETDGHEFGRDQRRDAEREGEDSAPCRRLPPDGRRPRKWLERSL